MSLNKYVVAIPSYKRPTTLKNKSLRVLQEHNIDPKRINIFVSDKEQENIYKKELPNNSYNKIIVGEPGIKNIRNFMPKYFKEGQKIFYMDDDISEVFQNFNQNKVPNKLNKNTYDKKYNKLKKIKNLHNFIEEAFSLAKKKKMDNWGVYPVENPYFMKPTTKEPEDFTSTYLSYIIGFMTGVINNRKEEIRTIDDKEDYERSIKYYLKDGGVLRFNNITCRTNCYKEPGGMQVERTKQRIHDSAVYLTKKYPQLCSLNTKKKSGFTEVRLKDKRENNNNNNNNNNNSNYSYSNNINKPETKIIDLSKPSSCKMKIKLKEHKKITMKKPNFLNNLMRQLKKKTKLKEIPKKNLPIRKCGM
uniref:Glycosyltransferase 2-like domain-containing protein n=1 Tax=viral metagenome TaxID=1070528 RepID=A0A6C0J790_9ZZZZ